MVPQFSAHNVDDESSIDGSNGSTWLLVPVFCCQTLHLLTRNGGLSLEYMYLRLASTPGWEPHSDVDIIWILELRNPQCFKRC